MSFTLLRYQTLKPRLFSQTIVTRPCYRGVQSHPNKANEHFFTPPAYPDTTEPPILIVDNQSRTRVMKWDEENATLSEAYIKADQDFIQQTDEAKERVSGMEKNKEVEMDEL